MPRVAVSLRCCVQQLLTFAPEAAFLCIETCCVSAVASPPVAFAAATYTITLVALGHLSAVSWALPRQRSSYVYNSLLPLSQAEYQSFFSSALIRDFLAAFMALAPASHPSHTVSTASTMDVSQSMPPSAPLAAAASSDSPQQPTASSQQATGSESSASPLSAACEIAEADYVKECDRLEGNPVCSTHNNSIQELCSTKLAEQISYSTSLSQCVNSPNCTDEILKMNPVTCQCAMPLEGTVVLRSPPFKDLEGPTRFQKLETSLIEGLNLKNGNGGVYLCCMAFDKNGYINIKVEIFPAYGMNYFNSTTLEKILFAFSNQTYKTPDSFGPYFFNLGKLYIIPGSTSKDSKSLKMGTIIGIAVGAAVLVLVIFILVVWAFRLKKKKDKLGEVPDPFASWGVSSGRTDAPRLQGAKCFSFKELKVATSNFSDENLIGTGGYGQVYKGFLPGGEMIAVKRAKPETLVQRGGSEFKTELELLSRVHHTNLVGLIGFCLEEREQMLVYEHMPNGSLRDNLYGRTGIRLDWKRRLRIALGTARGLVYLHEHANPPIIHRDVKSSNILLDMNMNAKVADFGLGKLLAIPGTNNAITGGHVTTEVKGTMGYVDPEYYMTQQLTQKSDVYSLGVVMLEIMAARQPIERGTYLVREARSAVDSRDGINELKRYLLDPFLRDICALPISTLERFVRLALHCTEEVASCRPTMSDVVKELESILEAVKALDSSGMESPTTDGSGSFVNSDPHLHNQHKSRFYPYASPTGSSNTTNSLDNNNAFGVSNFVEPK